MRATGGAIEFYGYEVVEVGFLNNNGDYGGLELFTV